MAGMISSIFGPTTEELRAKRMERAQDLLGDTFKTKDFGRRQAQQAGSLLGLGAAFLTNKYFGDSGMEKAREAEEKQAALDKQLGSIDRADDPRRFMILADAAKEVGDKEGYTKYINLAANYEQLAERRRQQYRDEQQKEANELSEQLDMRDKGIALSTIYDKDASEEERNKALQNFYQVGGTANDLYAYDQLNDKFSQGITKRQEDITDKFVSDISSGIASPAEVYANFKSIYGDEFIVPESFLDRFKTTEKTPKKKTLSENQVEQEIKRQETIYKNAPPTKPQNEDITIGSYTSDAVKGFLKETLFPFGYGALDKK